MKEKFKGIYFEKKRFYTKALIGEKVYGEKILKENGLIFREWNPFKSKYCAALTNGLEKNIFEKNSIVLYLGSAEGTTVSHVSDLVEKNGIIFCVDLSEIAMQKLTSLAEERENIFPILSDANQLKNYEKDVGKVDVLFQDISQRNQTEIFLKNSKLLKINGYGALSLKTKSISQETSKKTLEIEKNKLKKYFIIEQILSLEPFEKEHYLILVKKR